MTKNKKCILLASAPIFFGLGMVLFTQISLMQSHQVKGVSTKREVVKQSLPTTVPTRIPTPASTPSAALSVSPIIVTPPSNTVSIPAPKTVGGWYWREDIGRSERYLGTDISGKEQWSDKAVSDVSVPVQSGVRIVGANIDDVTVATESGEVNISGHHGGVVRNNE